MRYRSVAAVPSVLRGAPVGVFVVLDGETRGEDTASFDEEDRRFLGSMVALGIGVIVFGALLSVPGFAGLLFLGFFTFFTGKISADTIVQQAMPDDFRGRAFALFDIAYNLGFIVPALILSFVWVENDPSQVRTILEVSGAVFLVLTGLVWR